MENRMYKVRDNLRIPVEEAYKVLRTNIQFCGFDTNIKTLAVTSCNPGEGKTTTAINLAISMAKSGLKILLVDADLRKPMLAKHLGSLNSVGLTNVISGFAHLEDAVNATNIEGFYFISCGPKPPNPAEMIASTRFSDFLKSVKEQFDMVIIDTPPLGSVIDCAVVAAQTDGAIIVIKANSVEHWNARRVVEQLEKANAKILGVVLNRVSRNDYRSYYHNYDYYGSVKKEEKPWYQKLKEGWRKRPETRNA